MSVAVKTMPTPMPPPESKRVQWPPGGSGMPIPSLPGGKLASLTPGMNGEQPTKLQRPQSAIVNSMNRRLSAPGSSADVRRSADDNTKIAFEGGENEHRQVLSRATTERPHAVGSSEGSARNRPLSAMASISRAGAGVASSAEKAEIEDLKREIIEVTRRINSNRAELQQSDAKATSALTRTPSVDETEIALKRFITTNDPAQVQMAKNTLLCMVLQKHEELHRDTLSAINLQHGGAGSDAAGIRASSSGGPGSARDKVRGGSGRSRSAVMLALVDKTKSLSNQISDMKGETKSAATELQEAKHEICKLKEERELLRATLTQAGRSGSQTIKIVRPVSAPRARQAPAQADRPGSARAPVAACEGCDVLEVRIRETQTLLQEAQEANTALSDKIETLDQEKRAWQARAPPARKPDAPGPLPAAAATPAATSNGDSTKEIAALKQKVAQLEKTVVAKTKEAKAAADSAAADKKRADKLAKEAKDKDATIADLEKQLADALGKVSTLEKRLHDTSLNLKATSDSSGGALEREKELLKQIECLTKEMTEALKATDAAKQLTAKAEAAKAKLQETLGEERSEADAVQKKLIAELKEARGSTAEVERLRAALSSENARLLAELAKANGRISELEGELAALKNEGSGRSDAEARVVDLTKKLGVCQGQLAALQERYSGLDKDKAKALADLAALRKQFDEREAQFRAQVDKREGEVAAERDELLRRLRELEAGKSGSEGDKAELTLLRSRVKMLQEQVEEEKQTSVQHARAAQASEAEARTLRAEVKTSKEQVVRLEKEVADCKDLRKKLLAALRRADAADAALLKFEGEREETRAIENAFKLKMKTLYEKRVKELEAMQHDFEQRMMKEAEERARSGEGAGRHGAGARPATAASTTTGRRR